MNSEFKPIRCGNRNATPYLRKHFEKLCGDFPKNCHIADLGCGNMRNTNYIRSLGYSNIHSFDKVTSEGIEVDFKIDTIPLPTRSVSIILCNYVLMFLNKIERLGLISEMNRMASLDKCFIFVELYPAKKAYPYDQADIYSRFDLDGWSCVDYVKDRFVVRKGW